MTVPQVETPAHHDLCFYQCSNPNCSLRFPAPRGSGSELRICPRCKSLLRMVPTKDQAKNHNPRVETSAGLPPLEVLLDNIRSTFNVGAMLRTSDGAGIQRAHLCGITPQPGNPRISKVALGAEFAVPWEYHQNGVQAALSCKQRGLQVWALEINPGAVSIFEVSPVLKSNPAVLVVGNEVTGIDPGIMELCDQSLWIPMQGFKRSLNVAVAFGIAIYTLRFGFRTES